MHTHIHTYTYIHPYIHGTNSQFIFTVVVCDVTSKPLIDMVFQSTVHVFAFE